MVNIEVKADDQDYLDIFRKRRIKKVDLAFPLNNKYYGYSVGVNDLMMINPHDGRLKLFLSHCSLIPKNDVDEYTPIQEALILNKDEHIGKHNINPLFSTRRFVKEHVNASSDTDFFISKPISVQKNKLPGYRYRDNVIDILSYSVSDEIEHHFATIFKKNNAECWERFSLYIFFKEVVRIYHESGKDYCINDFYPLITNEQTRTNRASFIDNVYINTNPVQVYDDKRTTALIFDSYYNDFLLMWNYISGTIYNLTMKTPDNVSNFDMSIVLSFIKASDIIALNDAFKGDLPSLNRVIEKYVENKGKIPISLLINMMK